MKRRIFTVIAAVAVMVTAFSSVASAKSLDFILYRNNGAVRVTNNTKDVSGSTWKMSNNSGSGFIANNDVLGFKVWNYGITTPYTGYKPIKTFGTFTYGYTKTPFKGEAIALRGMVDSTSKRGTVPYRGSWVS